MSGGCTIIIIFCLKVECMMSCESGVCLKVRVKCAVSVKAFVIFIYSIQLRSGSYVSGGCIRYFFYIFIL